MLVSALALLAGLALLGGGLSSAASPPTSLYYGDVTLSGGFESGHFANVWDLTACDLKIAATVDLNGMVDDSGAHAWSELGARAVGYGDFNPTWDAEGAGVWLATDYDWTANTFAPDPVGSPTLDMDDKLILQKAGGHGEGDYNLPSAPPAPGNNHRVWFDRDGVDEWQDDSPLAVNGGTYNTGGIYDVVITMQNTDATSGTALMTINGLDQGFETDGNWNTMELTPAGMTFTGDMAQMEVFYGLYGYGATHSVVFQDITVTGCLVLEEGMATGGGWFVPDPTNSLLPTLDGSKATFGFVAKLKSGTSSGQLEFQYKADGLNLKSSSYDWVAVSATQVIFEGTGTLNGVGDYKFRVWAFDGDKTGGVDRFTIRIWTGNGGYESPTYGAEGDLGGGQVVVHKK
jgi:hypothetical protein